MCLAAALVPSLTPFDGGNVLAKMLEASASDKTLLPPSGHLKDLLNSLEHRCMQLRFSDLVVGWQVMLRNLGGEPALSAENRNPSFWSVANYAPAPDGLEKLVDAFRQLERLGDAITITLKAAACRSFSSTFYIRMLKES